MTMTLTQGWHEILAQELQQPYIQKLKAFLAKEQAENATIYPPADQIFSALRYTPFDEVRVVIVGQDPYHGPGQAHGLCFSVPEGVPQPPSLKNIFKEIERDLGLARPTSGSLVHWAEQGVLLLNATLTVRQGEPKSHYGRGWERLTDAIIAKLAARTEPLIFVLWGASAQNKCQAILEHNRGQHTVLKAAHPSPLSVRGFLGCGHFSEINRILKERGEAPVGWTQN